MTNKITNEITRLTWSGDIKARIYELLDECGYRSVMDYLLDHPSIPIVQITDKKEFLGFDQSRPIAAIQLEHFFAIECITKGELLFFFKDMFIRSMNYKNTYWDLHETKIGSVAIAFSAWESTQTHLPVVIQPFISDYIDKTWNILKEIVPNDGTWLPKNLNDPFIVEAFNHAWPDNIVLNKLLVETKSRSE
jgi:hypothetical protein